MPALIDDRESVICAKLLDIFNRSQYGANLHCCLLEFGLLLRANYTTFNNRSPYVKALVRGIHSALIQNPTSHFTKKTLDFLAKALAIIDNYDDELQQNDESSDNSSNEQSLRPVKRNDEYASDSSLSALEISRQETMMDDSLNEPLKPTLFRYLMINHFLVYALYKPVSSRMIVFNSILLIRNVMTTFKDIDTVVFCEARRVCCFLAAHSTQQTVRIHATMALGPFLSSTCEEIEESSEESLPEKIIIDKAQTSPCVSDRLIALKKLKVKASTLKVFFYRSCDIAEQVRRAAYRKLGKFTTISNFSTSERLRILSRGRSETEGMHSYFVIHVLVPWIESESIGRFERFLEFCDIKTNVGLGQWVIKEYFAYLYARKVSSKTSENAFYKYLYDFREQHLDENRLMKLDASTLERCFIWLYLIDFCRRNEITYTKTIANERADSDDESPSCRSNTITVELVDDIRPQLLHFIDHTSTFLKRLLDFRTITSGTDGTQLEDQSFFFYTLVQISFCYDLNQSTEWLALKALYFEIATCDDLYGVPSEYLELIMLLAAYHLRKDTQTVYLEFVLDLVNNINHPEPSAESQAQRDAIEARLWSLKSLIDPDRCRIASHLNEEASDFSIGNNTQGNWREPIEREIRELEAQLPARNDEPRMETDEVVLERLLHILYGAFKTTQLDFSSSAIDQLRKDVIMPVFEAGRNSNIVNFQLAVKTFALYCLRSVETIDANILLFLELIQRDEYQIIVRVDALEAVFAFVGKFGIKSFRPVRPLESLQDVTRHFINRHFGTDVDEVSFCNYFLQLVWNLLERYYVWNDDDLQRSVRTIDERLFMVAVMGSCQLIINNQVPLNNKMTSQFVARHFCISIKLRDCRSLLCNHLHQYLKMVLLALKTDKRSTFLTDTFVASLELMHTGGLRHTIQFDHYQAVINLMPIKDPSLVLPGVLLLRLIRTIGSDERRPYQAEECLVDSLVVLFDFYLPRAKKKAQLYFTIDELNRIVAAIDRMMPQWQEKLSDSLERVQARLETLKKQSTLNRTISARSMPIQIKIGAQTEQAEKNGEAMQEEDDYHISDSSDTYSGITSATIESNESKSKQPPSRHHSYNNNNNYAGMNSFELSPEHQELLAQAEPDNEDDNIEMEELFSSF